MLAMAVLVIGRLFFELPHPLAVIAHQGGTVLVVFNGLRLLAGPKDRRGANPTWPMRAARSAAYGRKDPSAT